MPYNLCKKALRRLYEIKGKAAMVFVTVNIISALLFALRYFLPLFMAIDLLTTDKKITKEFFIFAVSFLVMAFLAVTPLKIGTKRWFYKVANGEDLKFFEIFFFFKPKSFLKCIALKIRVYFKKFSLAFLLFTPPFLVILEIIYMRSYQSDESLLFQMILSFVFMVLTVCVVWIFILLSSRYFLTEYLIGDTTVKNALKKSKEYMSQKRKNLFFIYLSFVIFFPIYYLYKNMTLAFYARKLTSKE